MSEATQTILADIEAFCARNGIAESTFGVRAVNDGKLVSRLRAGRTITLPVYEAIRRQLGSETESAAQ